MSSNSSGSNSLTNANSFNSQLTGSEIHAEEGKQQNHEMPGHYKELVQKSQDSSGKLSIDSFSMLKVIGRGAYGKVTLVRKKDTGVVYAMKALKKKHLRSCGQVERTKTERKILEKIDHPYVIKMHFAFQNESKLFMVLDYCPGGELFFHLQNCKRFNESTARFFASNIVLALEHLHSQNIVYRDLKPQNVLIDRHGFAILTDFGLSKEDISKKQTTKSICGTPEYLAPEVLQQTGYSQAVDWWSLGCLIYEMLIGLPPYYEESRKKLLHKILNEKCQIPPGLGMEAQDIITGLLTKDPKTRLGNREFGIQEIKAHPWFNGVDWDSLAERKVKPPFVPTLGSDDDDSFISKEFTQLPLHSPMTQGGTASSQEAIEYNNFTFEKTCPIPKQ